MPTTATSSTTVTTLRSSAPQSPTTVSSTSTTRATTVNSPSSTSVPAASSTTSTTTTATAAQAASAPILAASGFPRSERVALVPNAGGRQNNGGVFPTSGFPDGYAPVFTDVSIESIRDNLADPVASGFDTLLLNSICDIGGFLSNAQFKSRIEGFASRGGKLLIWDSECTSTVYTDFAIPFETSNPGAAGAQGTLTDAEENTLSSTNNTSPSYVDLDAVATGTDAVGDANVFTTFDARWFLDLKATNNLGVNGAAQAYANLGDGIVIYNGLDKDFAGGGGFDPASTSGAVHLNRIWLLDLLQPWNPDGLPHANPVIGGGANRPAWVAPTPSDGSRFDYLPGKRGTFNLAAVDPNGDPLSLTFKYFSANASRNPVAKPSYLSCFLPTIFRPGVVGAQCTVTPKTTGLTVVQVDVTDSKGGFAGQRNYLVGGSNYKYIALGDSYSSGEGVDPYFKDGYDPVKGTQTGDVDNRCHRSSRAHATYVHLPSSNDSLYALASGKVHPGDGRGLNKYGSDINFRSSGNFSWGLLACAGATIPNVLQAKDGGLVPSSSGGFREIVTQLDNGYVDYATDLVTITIGGNDVLFSKVLLDCALFPCNTPAKEAQLRHAIASLKPYLVDTYKAILTKTFNARVLVLGYPQLFPATSEEQSCAGLSLFSGEQTYIRNLTTLLNRTIGEAAAEAKVDFEDVTSEFAGHEACGNKKEWINGVSKTGKLPKSGFIRLDDESFHPKLEGQRDGYAAIVNRYLASKGIQS